MRVEALENLDRRLAEGSGTAHPAYTDIGDGDLDLVAALGALARHGYRCWATIEIETLRRADIR